MFLDSNTQSPSVVINMARFSFSFFTVLCALFYSCNTKKENEKVLYLEEVQRILKVLNDTSGIPRDTIGFSELPKIDFLCDEEYQFERKYYSIIDLNHDGLKDLIYSGPCLVYDQTVIFIQKGSRFLKIYDEAGRVVSVRTFDSMTHVYSQYEPVGCYSDNHLSEISIKNDSIPIVKRINYVKFPKMTLNSLKLIKVKGVLRWSPKEDEVDRKDPCSDNVIHGNHLLRIENERSVIQVAREKDWSFVLYKTDEANSILGWIKKEQ